jgi:hypothetical protein
MTQESLYLDMTKHFERLAPLRATGDTDRHTDSAFASFLEALTTYAHFAAPMLLYIGTRAGDHLIDRVTDGVVDKAIAAARRFGQSFLERLRKEVARPTTNFDPKEFETVASQADEFGVVLTRRASALQDGELKNSIADGQAAARSFLISQLGFSNDEAERVTQSIAVDIRKAIERTRTKDT